MLDLYKNIHTCINCENQKLLILDYELLGKLPLWAHDCAVRIISSPLAQKKPSILISTLIV